MTEAIIESPGCVVILIDESAAMDSSVQEEVEFGQKAKSKAQSIATAVNSLFKQLAAGPDFDVALVGYRVASSGEPFAGSRWAGELGGRDFVSLKEIAAHPISVESRVRRIPDPSTFTGFREETVEFPVWCVPSTGGIAPQVHAFQHCGRILSEWLKGAGPNPGPPLVIHLCAAGSGDGNPAKAISEIQAMQVGTGAPLVFQAQLTASKTVPATLYAAKRGFLQAGPVRDLYDRCSVLPPPLVTAVKQMHIPADNQARGVVANAKMVDIVQFLSLVKSHTKNWPARAAVSAPAEQSTAAPPDSTPPEQSVAVSAANDLSSGIVDTVESTVPANADLGDVASLATPEEKALVVLLLNRSLEDPFAADPKSAWARLQDHANQLLSTIAKGSQGKIEVGVVSYGRDSVGEIEIRKTFDGPLTGQSIVKDCDLAVGALRVDEVEQQEPNGVGGLMTITVKKKIFVELDPTSAASMQPAFDAVSEIVRSWCAANPSAGVPPIILHMTRDAVDAAELEHSASELGQIRTEAGAPRLYHLVATEKPHSSVSYPDSDATLQTPELKKIWSLSSSLLGGDKLAESQPHLVKANSKGVVVNGKFDLLVKGITSGWSS
jgi:hypothetical protein